VTVDQARESSGGAQWSPRGRLRKDQPDTGTTVITFLMVFLIQNAQYCDVEAVQVKLDEWRVAEGARADLLLGKCDAGVPDVA